MTAETLGWTTWELFGVHCRAPYARIDALGLVPLLNGGRVTELSAAQAIMRMCSGSTLVYRRKPPASWPSEQERALIWDAGVDADKIQSWMERACVAV
jgi:hypothetical protein